MSRKFMRTLKGSAIASILALVLAGCGGTSQDASIDSGSFSSLIAQLRAAAEASGASDAQIALIDRAAERGEVTLDDLHDAYDNLAVCLEEAGLGVSPYRVNDKQVPPHPIIKIIGHGDENGMDPEDEAKGDACVEQEYNSLSLIYDMQPSSIEAADSHLAKEIPNITACLADHGYDIDSGLSVGDFKKALLELESSGDDGGYAAGDAVGKCLFQSDILGY